MQEDGQPVEHDEDETSPVADTDTQTPDEELQAEPSSLPGRSWLIIITLGAVTAIAVALIGFALFRGASSTTPDGGESPSPRPTPTQAEPTEEATPVGEMVVENKFLTPDTPESNRQSELESDVSKSFPNSATSISNDILLGLDQKSPMVFAFDEDATSATSVAEAIQSGLPPGWQMATEGVNCRPTSGVTPIEPAFGDALLLINLAEGEMCVFGITSDTLGPAQVIVVQGKGAVVDEELVNANGRDPLTGRAFVNVPPSGVIIYVGQEAAEQVNTSTGPEPMPEASPSESVSN